MIDYFNTVNNKIHDITNSNFDNMHINIYSSDLSSSEEDQKLNIKNAYIINFNNNIDNNINFNSNNFSNLSANIGPINVLNLKDSNEYIRNKNVI